MSWSGGQPGGGARGGHAAGGRREFVRPADDPPGTSRLFVAVPVADDVRDGIRGVMEKVAGGSIDERAFGQPRWVRVEGLHLTLRFLGATPDERQPALAEAISAVAVGVEPFSVALSGGGAFPDPRRPRVLWIGISEGADRLGDMAHRLDERLKPLGWPPESRPFAPHLTLARTDGVPGADERAQRLAEVAAGVSFRWRADRIVLYKSILGRGPARYEALATAELAGSQT
jgi:RNA 2',3'-cyclic 3'-phosphodiesterase